jgi:hypothetical protein
MTGNVPPGVTYYMDLATLNGLGNMQAAAIASGVVGVVDKGVDAVQEGRMAAIKEY